ncbi:Bdr family repetitive protein [Borreliella garinii]|uniref:Repeat motif-containing gene protein n=3 Tax=Borreliella garinii TaxID=29519 RepID=B8F0I2_BORGR|nr:Bdr family repetitive protein [Borreliella garinii]ACL34431.1 repeat motif-containing gene protein [Borreliella garinii PBr]
MKSVLKTTNITEEQIYKEFLRLGMEQLIAQDLSKRYYHNELTYRDLENLEKQFGIKFEYLDFKIDTLKSELNTKIDNVEKNLQKDIANLDAKIDTVEKNLKQNLDEKLKINNQFLLEKIEINNQFLLEKIEINNQLLSKNLDSSNRLITIMSIVLVPIAIAIIGPFVLSLINGFFKQ